MSRKHLHCIRHDASPPAPQGPHPAGQIEELEQLLRSSLRADAAAYEPGPHPWSLPAPGAAASAVSRAEPPWRMLLPAAAAGSCLVLALALALRLPPPAEAVRSAHRAATPAPDPLAIPTPKANRRGGSDGSRSSSQAAATTTADAGPEAPERSTARRLEGFGPVATADYLDGRDPDLARYWVSGGSNLAGAVDWADHLPPVKDDFVSVPLSRTASSSPAALTLAMQLYRQQAAVVDTRLFRKVSLGLKGTSLEEVCDELEKATGVRFDASRGVEDEKATVFVRELPARDLMRGIARLFGFRWIREGEEGSYRYELMQDLKQRLAEEELRNRDANAALLAMDAEMDSYRPYLGLTVEQLKTRLARATGPEKAKLRALVEQGGWGALQVYARLSPAERIGLRNGEPLRFDFGEQPGYQRLPAEWAQPLLQTWNVGVNLGTTNGREFWRGTTPLSAAPGATPRVMIALNRTELGQLSLEGTLHVRVQAGEREFKGRQTTAVLATGQSPSAARPDNAAENRALAGQAAFRRTVELKPKPVCPAGAVTEGDLLQGEDAEPERTALSSAEVWEELHRATGQNVVADYFTRIHPASDFVMAKVSVFDALCRAGDRLGVRWRQDGPVLLARSTSYYWDKLKEVPNRYLRRWKEDARTRTVLPLVDVLEMASMTDQQLDSDRVAQGIVAYWGLREWALVSRENSSLRKIARFLAALSTDQRRQLETEPGLPFTSLLPAQRQQFFELEPQIGSTLQRLEPETLAKLRFWTRYSPAGWYWWAPRDPNGSLQVRSVMETHPTAEATLAAARRIDPSVTPDQVRRSHGDLLFHAQIGDLARFGLSRTHGFFNLLREDAAPLFMPPGR